MASLSESHLTVVTALRRFPASALLIDMDGVLVDSTGSVAENWSRWADRRGLPRADVLRFAHGSPSREMVARFVPHWEASEEAAWVEGLATETVIEQALPGALALLAQRLLPLAVVTSATRQVAVGRLLRADLPVPAILVSCDDVEQGKPDPEPYLLAAARLGVDAVACVGIEDTPAGLMALRAAGCAALAVLTTHSADE